MNFKFKTCAVGPIAALALALVVAGCGGGGGGSSGTVTPTSSVYSGPITGFGSVIVNGVRFDTVGATTLDDDDNEVRLEDLRIGMMVTISGDANDTSGRGTATRLSLSRGTTGPITSAPIPAVDPTGGTFDLVGQPVQTDTSTVYVGIANGFAGLQLNGVVEVHGVLQSNGILLATVIEDKSGFTGVRLVGRMTAVNTDAKTFVVGGVTVNYDLATLTGTPENGKRVKIKTTTDVPDVNNLLTLTSGSTVKVKGGAAYGETVPANTYLKLKGIAEAGASSVLWTVAGTPVDVSGADFEGGRTIAAGDFIEVKGIWDGSVLKATKVETDDPSDDDRSNELYGAVSDVQPSSGTPTSIVVHGVTVDVTGASFPSGQRAALAVGSYVEVEGRLENGVFVATQVKLKTGQDAADDDFEHQGTISEFSSRSSFKVNGVPVDASSATFEDGLPGDLSDGDYVEIKGALVGGIFIATKVEFKGNDD